LHLKAFTTAEDMNALPYTRPYTETTTHFPQGTGKNGGGLPFEKADIDYQYVASNFTPKGKPLSNY